MDRTEYMREYRKKHRARIREQYRDYNREYQRKRRGSFAGMPKGGPAKKGRRYELLALTILVGAVDKNSDNFRGGWDIEYKGQKIDVKSREVVNNKTVGKYGGWYFTNLNKRNEVDAFLFFCLRCDTVAKVLLIPAKVCKRAIFIAGGRSKYDTYAV